MAAPQLCLTLSEIWTMADPRDLLRVVEFAKIAEAEGIGSVMVGEHLVMGPNSDAKGQPLNLRDWAMAGNQAPETSYPDSLALLSAMATVTTDLGLIAAAVISPLRSPLVLAKSLATVDLLSQGRLSFVPTVSWQAEEYEALGADFGHRGKILDEQLEVWKRLWTDGSPVSYSGEYFNFSEISVEPAPFRPNGPVLWTGGKTLQDHVLRRVVEYGQGLFLVIPPNESQLAELAEALQRADRDIADFSMATAIPTSAFTSANDLLDLDETLDRAPELVEQGFDTLILKPSMFFDDPAHFSTFCRDAVQKFDRVLGN